MAKRSAISETEDSTEIKGTVEPAMTETPEEPAPVAVAPSPVAVGVQKTLKPTSLVLPMVNSRASHFYFKRVNQILKSLGKFRRS